MQRGIAAPILIVLFGILALSGLGVTQKLFKPSEKQDVRGSSTFKPVKSGFSVTISSTGTWDLFQYLCEDAACLESLESGKKYATVSGGETESHDVVVSSSPEWNKYKFVKVHVKSGWGAGNTSYQILKTDKSDAFNVNRKQLPDEQTEILIIPIEKANTTFIENLATFTDK